MFLLNSGIVYIPKNQKSDPPADVPQKVGQFKVRIKLSYESGTPPGSFLLGAVLSSHCCNIQYISSVPV